MVFLSRVGGAPFQAAYPGPAPMQASMTSETATFAAGCFWGVQEAFDNVEGVTATEVGYTGGQAERPTYEQVCSGGTGHAEAVRVEFDPAVVSFENLVRFFYDHHDPTQLDRQGPDVGDQYRSAVFTHGPEQEEVARRVTEELDAGGRFQRPIATRIEPAGPWWPAEDYHQKYFERRGGGAMGVLRRLGLR